MKTMNIGNKEIEIREEAVKQSELLFYTQNPRVYSSLNITKDNTPSQKEIEEYMTRLEHVKRLKQSIEANGLTDPIIVCKNVVVEGNSRLAAYRILVNKDPIKWGLIPAVILPDDTDEGSIFLLLGQYHIIGRQDWSPYEQAGYLYRRKKETKKPVEEISKELGMNLQDVKKFISVYELMLENEDNISSKWSYYEELTKNAKIRKKDKESPDTNIFNFVAKQIKDGLIENAQDIRKIGTIVSTEGKSARKALKDYMGRTCSLDEALDRVDSTGKTDSLYKKAKSFRDIIADVDLDQEIANNQNLKFALKKIYQKLGRIFK